MGWSSPILTLSLTLTVIPEHLLFLRIPPQFVLECPQLAPLRVRIRVRIWVWCSGVRVITSVKDIHRSGAMMPWSQCLQCGDGALILTQGTEHGCTHALTCCTSVA